MSEEVIRILKMVEEGKISAEQAKDLMEAMNNQTTTEVVGYNSNYEDKFLKVKVLSAQGDKVDVKLPIKIIKEVLRVSGKLPINTGNMQGVDMEQLVNTIVQCLDNEVMGEIVNVNSAQGDIVQVVIE